jgi:hypothetical protein
MQDTPEKDAEETTPQPLRADLPPYAGGTDIHVGPGEETTLPHEGTHQPAKRGLTAEPQPDAAAQSDE